MRTHIQQPKRHGCSYPGCDYSSNDRSRLTRHLKAVHLQVKSEACDVMGCEFRAATRSAIQKHKINIHQVPRFACPIDGCPKKFKWAYKLKTHMASEHSAGSNLLKCKYPGCSYSSKDEKKLKDHLKNKHNDYSLETEVKQGMS